MLLLATGFKIMTQPCQSICYTKLNDNDYCGKRKQQLIANRVKRFENYLFQVHFYSAALHW